MKKLLLVLIIGAALLPQGQVQAVTGQRWINIPALNLSQEVETVPYDGYQWDTTRLKEGIGTLEYLDWLNGGNTVLVGHNPGAFSHLDEIELGDTIYVYDAADVYKFKVSEIFTVEETAIYIYYSTESQRLTLFTCYGRVDKAGDYLDRLVVIAEPAP